MVSTSETLKGVGAQLESLLVTCRRWQDLLAPANPQLGAVFFEMGGTIQSIAAVVRQAREGLPKQQGNARAPEAAVAAPAPKPVVVSAPQPEVRMLRRRGRPAGSKNKPKLETPVQASVFGT